jgi:segregation and condensation protein A
MAYHIKIEDYEGPFDVLLEMIEKQKLDVTRLSLASIADDFLVYVEKKGDIGIAGLSEFLYIASQLILIKSKALLPLFEFTQEEEEELDDLEQRLKEYQTFKAAAEKMIKIFSSSEKYWSRSEENLSYTHFSSPGLSKEDLKKVFSEIVEQIPKAEELSQEIVREVISIEEKILQLRESLEKRAKVAFEETIKSAADKIDVIVTFLAMLEMIKQKIITAKQEKIFDQILIEKIQIHG